MLDRRLRIGEGNAAGARGAMVSGRMTGKTGGAMDAHHLLLNSVTRYAEKASARYLSTVHCHGRASLAWEKSLF